MSYSIKELYSSFLKGRKTFLGVSWWKPGSFVKRVLGRPSEFSNLVAYENTFVEKGLIWLGQLEHEGYLDKSQIPSYRVKLKLFKEELTSRNGFLIAFAVLIAAGLSFNKFLGEALLETDVDYWLYIPSSFFAILAITERAYVLANASYASQLEILLEHWESKKS